MSTPNPIDWSHVDALYGRLHRETMRLRAATNDRESEFRRQQIASCQREIEAEYRFLGVEQGAANAAITDVELIAELADFANLPESAGGAPGGDC